MIDPLYLFAIILIYDHWSTLSTVKIYDINIGYIDQQTLPSMLGKHSTHYIADIADWISQIYFD